MRARTIANASACKKLTLSLFIEKEIIMRECSHDDTAKTSKLSKIKRIFSQPTFKIQKVLVMNSTMLVNYSFL
jgi:hypothetical protein